MRIYYPLLFLFPFLIVQAQEMTDQDLLRKCIKESGEKICLSDEDKDLVPFYKDKCSKEFGFAKNFGCPWPDEDKDGVPDREDACPKKAGDPLNEGCPWLDTYGGEVVNESDSASIVTHKEESLPKINGEDCDFIRNKDSLDMVVLRNEYKDINTIYDLLSDQIFNTVNGFKRMRDKDVGIDLKMNDIGLLIWFIDYDNPCDVPGCCPDWKNVESNYLRIKFWNEKTLEKFFSSKKVKQILLETDIPSEKLSDFKDFWGDPMHSYLMKYYDKEEKRIRMSKGSEIEINIEIVIKFINPYKVNVWISDGHYIEINDNYSFNGKIWEKQNRR